MQYSSLPFLYFWFLFSCHCSLSRKLHQKPMGGRCGHDRDQFCSQQKTMHDVMICLHNHFDSLQDPCRRILQLYDQCDYHMKSLREKLCKNEIMDDAVCFSRIADSMSPECSIFRHTKNNKNRKYNSDSVPKYSVSKDSVPKDSGYKDLESDGQHPPPSRNQQKHNVNFNALKKSHQWGDGRNHTFISIDGERFDFSSQTILGEGTIDSVYLAYLERNPAIVIALKKKRYSADKFGDEVGALTAIGEFMGEDPDRNLIGMAYHPGNSVETLLKNGLSREEKDTIFQLALSKLETLHQAGWVHRHLNADNVIISPDLSDAWIIDFKLAKSLSEYEDDENKSWAKDSDILKLKQSIYH